MVFWQQADQQIRSRKTDSMQDVEFLRGQLAMVEFLLNLRDITIQRHKNVKKALEEQKISAPSA